MERIEPEAAEAILARRAKALARPHGEAQAAGPCLEVLEFRLDQTRYALESRAAGGVVPLEHVTPVPCTPPFVLGVVNVRGRITAVIDIRRFFRLAEGAGQLQRMIVVHGQGLEFGLPVHAIEGLGRLPLAAIQPPPTPEGGRQYVKGVTADGVLVLDVEAILADPGLVVHDEVVADQ